ncbi:hypothetical protein ALC57_15635 [Trachymyrmex cornetzi]|uniref:Envelope fusion protein n=1 Tax=Trachymyrmex cornetzi TaxID=471704 RepID=A0A151IWP7_9HYME|nr:hypothetical protein ALC57_15635 [Trachymyrmex cornetzi]
MLKIFEKNNEKLSTSLNQLKIVYKATQNKRGLIDAIGTVSKTLFGTMDADDAKQIYEQLQLLEGKEQMLQHVAKNQLKIINATIDHIDHLRKAVAYNKNLLANITTKMELQLDKYTHREDLDEYFQIILAILTDLLTDVDKTEDYLVTAQHGILRTNYLLLEHIVKELREVASQLTKGLHFPFQIKLENWHAIQKHMLINAFVMDNDIFTILKFPIIAYPTYKIIRVTPLPVYEQLNVFKFIKVVHSIIALDRENNHYTLLNENELKECILDMNMYTCERTFPIYQIQSDAPCEVQIFENMPGQFQNCEYGRVLASTTLWITPSEERTWLYSTLNNQECTVICNGLEEKMEISKTGKIKLKGDCKLTTSDIILKTKSRLETRYIQTHLSEFNLTLNIEKENNFDLPRHTLLKKVIGNTEELTKLSLNLNELDEYLNNNQSMFNSKYFIYPVGSGILVIVLASVIGVAFWIKKKKLKN